MKAVMNMYNVLENETFMEKTGFLYSNLVDHNVITDHEVQQEDELADLLGDFNLSLGQSRTRRQAYMYGWPHLMVETLGTLDEARAVLQLFNDDSTNVHALQAELNPTELQSEYTHRSQFQTLAVKQLECGAKHHNYEPAVEYLDHVSNGFRCVNSTKTCGRLQQPPETCNAEHAMGRPLPQTTEWLVCNYYKQSCFRDPQI